MRSSQRQLPAAASAAAGEKSELLPFFARFILYGLCFFDEEKERGGEREEQKKKKKKNSPFSLRKKLTK